MPDSTTKPDVGNQQDPVPPSQIELTEQQFKPILEKLQQKPPKDRLETWNKRLDLVEKILISLGIGFFSTYLAWQEFRVKRSEFNAKSFAGLFAEKQETRLESAAAAVNDLDGDALQDFVRVVLSHFDDVSPTVRDYAKLAVINMASSCYDSRNKIPKIVDVMAEGMKKERDKPTKEQTVEVVGQIGYPTENLLQSFAELLEDPGEDANVVVKSCSAITNMKWAGASDSFSGEKVFALRGRIEALLKQSGQPDGVINACKGALPMLPSK